MLVKQAVLLAGGTGSRLYPLNSTGTPKALLPVGNQPLISFPLRSLEEAGIQEVFVMCYGEAAAAQVQAWLSKHYTGDLQLTVRSIAKDASGSHTVAALRAVAGKLTGASFMLLSGDLVTDAPLKALLASHYVNGATVTSLLTRRRTSPSAETKPGKAPSHVDYVGLQEGGRLAFFDTSAEVPKRSVKLPIAALLADGCISIRTDLADQHCYVFDRKAVFQALEAKPGIAAIKEDLVPYLVSHQARGPSKTLEQRAHSLADSLPSSETLGSWNPSAGRQGWWAGAFIPAGEHFCMRANTLAAYGDVNREVLAPERAARFLELKPNVEGYYRHESAQVGPRSTVAAGCLLPRGCRVGEKCTVKRSVLGPGCVLGANVRLINSVLMERVTVGDDCTVQNCILCSGSRLQAEVQLRDCQVGPDYTVTEGSEHRGETFDKSKPAAPG